MAVRRLDANPLLRPSDVKPTRDDLEVVCTLNPAAVRVDDEVLLIVRVGEQPADSPQQTERERAYCPRCGARSEAGDRYCALCGSALGGSRQ